MSRKHQYNVLNRDPEKVGRLREVLDGLYDQELAELGKLASETITSPYRVDPKDSRAGEKWLAETRGREYTATARDARIASKLRLIETILDLTVTPRVTAEADEAEQAHSVEADAAQRLLDAVRGRLNADQLKQIRSETGDAFNVPMPEGSDPEGDDE